jgi:DNA-binding NarL/FixJ family response regulator
MGVGAFAERARGELAATGEPAPPTPPKRQGPLTAQEERIAQMAAAGLSNGEIAGQLYISPRTVEYHLHKVFRALGIGSRTRLAHEFARLATPPD